MGVSVFPPLRPMRCRLAAFPVRYGISGVLTFIVNQEGVVYQKDLGPKTVVVGNEMTAFDPDETWTKGK